MIKRNILDCMTLVGGTPLRFEGEKTYVSTGAVDCDHVDYAQTERVTYDNRPSRANLSVAEGDILFAKMCGTKKTLRIDRPLSEHLYSTGFCAVRANESLMDAALLYHLLASDQFLTQKDQNSSGATQKAITNAGLRKIVIQVPDLPDQRKLAANLDCIEQMMANRREQLVSFDQLVKSRFIELFGTVKDNPYHFPTATLKEVCHKITDGKHGGCEQETDSGYYYVGAREIYDGVIHYDTAPQITFADFAKDYRRCNIEQGDMVIVNTGATIGKSAIASSPLTERTLLQKSVALIKVKTDVISANFLRYCYMANPSMYMVESASAQPNLLLSKMNATVIYLPPMELQEQFATFVEQTDKSKYYSSLSFRYCQAAANTYRQEWMTCRTSDF